MIALALYSSLFASSHAFSGVVESTITVKSKETYCNPLSPQITDLVVLADGETKSIAPAGSQVSVETAVTGNCETDHPVTIVLEVRDMEGATAYLAYQHIAMDQGQARTSFSWLAEDVGDYKVRIFALTCISCSGLAPIKSVDFTIS